MSEMKFPGDKSNLGAACSKAHTHTAQETGAPFGLSSWKHGFSLVCSPSGDVGVLEKRPWSPSSRSGRRFAHSNPWFPSLVGKFPAASIREQSQFTEAWGSQGAALLFYMWKMRKGPDLQHWGDDERWKSISKVTLTKRSIQLRGGGRGQASSWEVFVAPGRRGCDVH